MAQQKTLARAFFAALDTLPEPPRLSFAQTAFEAFTGALGDAPEPRHQAAVAAAVKDAATPAPARARAPAKPAEKTAPVRRARKARTARAPQAQTGNGTAAAA